MDEETNIEKQKPGSNTKKTLKIIGVIILVMIIIVAVWVKQTLYAGTFTPVELDVKEQKVLDDKLALLDAPAKVHRSYNKPKKSSLEPEPYSEAGARREIHFTKRELNGLLAEDIAQRVAIDLSDDLVSVKLVVPVDEEMPVLGGKTLKFHMGLIIDYDESRPIVALKGISLGGIPLPNAWLGYLKNKNLMDEFGTEDGFWKLFSEGVQDIQVRDKYLKITLKE